MRTWATLFLLLFCLAVQAQPKRHFVPDPHLREALRRAELMTRDSLDEGKFWRTPTIFLHTDSIRNWEGWQYLDKVRSMNISLHQIHIDSTFHWPKHLERLTMNQADVPVLTGLPEGMKQLEIYRSRVLCIKKFPSTLKWLKILNKRDRDSAYDVRAVTLPHLSTSLQELELAYLDIRYLPSLPRFLHTLQLSHMVLDRIPPLPPHLFRFSASNCTLRHFPRLPSRLGELNYAESVFPLEDLPLDQRYVLCEYPESNCLARSQKVGGDDSVKTLPITRIDSIKAMYFISPDRKRGGSHKYRSQFDSTADSTLLRRYAKGVCITQIYLPLGPFFYSMGYRIHALSHFADSGEFVSNESLCETQLLFPILTHHQKQIPEFYFEELAPENRLCPYPEIYIPGRPVIKEGSCTGDDFWYLKSGGSICVWTNAGCFSFGLDVFDDTIYEDRYTSNERVRLRAGWLYSYQIVKILNPPFLTRNPYTVDNLRNIVGGWNR